MSADTKRFLTRRAHTLVALGGGSVAGLLIVMIFQPDPMFMFVGFTMTLTAQGLGVALAVQAATVLGWPTVQIVLVGIGSFLLTPFVLIFVGRRCAIAARNPISSRTTDRLRAQRTRWADG